VDNQQISEVKANSRKIGGKSRGAGKAENAEKRQGELKALETSKIMK